MEFQANVPERQLVARAQAGNEEAFYRARSAGTPARSMGSPSTCLRIARTPKTTSRMCW